MHKKIIIAYVAIALCIVGTLAGVAYAAASDSSGNMLLAGQYFKSANAERPFSSSKDAQIVAEYNGHKITTETVAYQKNMNILRDSKTATKYGSGMDVIHQIVKSMILLEEAEKLGLTATEAESMRWSKTRSWPIRSLKVRKCWMHTALVQELRLTSILTSLERKRLM